MTGKKSIRAQRLAGFLLAAIGAVVVAGCASQGTNGIVQPVSMAISLCNRTSEGCAGTGAFSLSTIRDLSVDVRWSHLAAGTHTQTAELIEPGGGSYQVQNVSFAIDEASGGTAQASAVFPIAGSWITQRNITGSWSVRVSLDGQNVETLPLDFQP